MIILFLILTVLVTIVAVVVTLYSSYLTNQVSGEKLLTMNSKLGYKYATIYRDWQNYSKIAIAIAIVIWMIFLVILIRTIIKKQKEKKKVIDN